MSGYRFSAVSVHTHARHARTYTHVRQRWPVLYAIQHNNAMTMYHYTRTTDGTSLYRDTIRGRPTPTDRRGSSKHWESIKQHLSSCLFTRCITIWHTRVTPCTGGKWVLCTGRQKKKNMCDGAARRTLFIIIIHDNGNYHCVRPRPNSYYCY